MKENWNIKLELIKIDSLPNWYEIVVGGLPEMYWMQKRITNNKEDSWSRLHSVRRISDACVEGNSDEMLSIANHIRTKTSIEYKRCAVYFEFDKAYFYSPRNSSYMGEVSYNVALELANEIENKITKYVKK